MSMVKNEDFNLVKGRDDLVLYQFHSNIAKHYFCSKCGIYTHHNPRSNPKLTGINIGCLDEIAYRKKWITKKQLLNNIDFYGNCPYSEYLKNLKI